jgi:acetate kinase
MSDCIAVINAGSSSVKFAIYEPGEVIALYRGQVEGIGTAPRLRIVNAKGEAMADRTWSPDSFMSRRRVKSCYLGSNSCRAGSVASVTGSSTAAGLMPRQRESLARYWMIWRS